MVLLWLCIRIFLFIFYSFDSLPFYTLIEEGVKELS